MEEWPPRRSRAPWRELVSGRKQRSWRLFRLAPVLLPDGSPQESQPDEKQKPASPCFQLLSTKVCPPKPEPILPSRLFQPSRTREPGPASSGREKLCVLLISTYTPLTIGCERVPVGWFARRFVGS